jgi:RHS repeat-associated protein
VGQIRQNRTGASNPWPVQTHRLATTYEYNSFGQLVSQNTPDGGATVFIYDSQNRLRFSQNDRQKPGNSYSYTKYDALGRIVEVGESQGNGPDFTNLQAPPNLALADNSLAPQPGGSVLNRQVTRTIYSIPSPVTCYGMPQRFTQNRVSYTLIDDDPLTAGDEHYTYFSYDSHGNVEWIVQDDPGGIGQNNIRYDYDLVSGKVLRVSYNENRADRFFHRYVYDADNRLTATETSRDGEIWDRDAFYAYYPHGPLKRTELGEDHVQGLDYIYTIQGWLKALNSPALVNGDDPGQDNSSTGPALGRTAEDRFGMVLNYYNGDYSTNTLNFLTANSNYSLAAYSGSNGAAPSLYNGNISGWIQSQLDNTASGPEAPRADLFRYDILNRIRQSTSVKEDPLLGWSAIHTADSYSTGYTYDANGNILSLTRADELGDAMDEFSYTYDHGAGLSNRLTGLSDAVTVTQSGRADLQGTHTYSYDPTGNLVEETGEELLDYGSGAALYNFTTTISWNVYGKIREVNKTILRGADPLREKLRFRYDAAGNRVRKEFWKDDVTVHDGIEDPEEVTTTFYVRDAQGNTMATYRRSYDVTDQLFKLHLTEQPIYGSERLGMNTKPLLLASAASVGGLGTPVNGPQSISEYQNWITTSSKTQLLPAGASVNNDNLCQCRVIAMNLNQPGSQYQYAQNALEFLGIAHNGIALAEDLSGDLQFFVVQAKAYLGAKDACLVFDRSGKLMQGNEKIGPVAVNSKPVIVNLPGTNRYNIVTLDAQRHPVYHVVDMNSQGYGPVGNMGEVLSGNNPLDPSITNTALTHGYHFTGVEDHVTGNSIVYSSRYTPDPLHPGQGTTDLLAYDFGSGTLTPQSHLLYSQNGCGDSGQGQLQISPDGGKLGWWQYTEQMAGFSHRQADIYTLPLNSSRTGLSAAPSQFSISAAGSYGNGLLEFMKNSDNLLYSQRGLYQENSGSVKYDKNIWNYDPLNLSSVSINPDSPTLSYLFGEIKRGKDGNYYIPHMGQAADKLHSYSGSAFGSDVSLPDKTYELASSWPTQVYKIFNQGSTVQEYKRRVGEKSYELKDHLGNVRVVISDAKQIIDTDADNTVSSADSFEPEVLSYNDYYAFGMLMPGRQFNSGNYRYGFNGQEKDDEIAGIGNIMTAEYWEYDARIGRRWNMDPKPTIGISDYACFANNPIWNTDPFGDKVRNGYEKDLANAKERVADKQKKFNDAKGLNKFFKGVGLAFSKANLNVVQSRYDETDALIEKYKQANPEDYEKIDNLQNEKNEEVDVFVRVEPNLKVNDRSINKPEGINLDGLTSMYYETEPDTKDNAPKVIPYSQHYGRNTVLVRVNSSAGNKKKTLGHEFGHTFFNVVSSTWMQTWILLHPNAPAGGHGKDAASGEPNPSGVAAEEWEKRTK